MLQPSEINKILLEKFGSDLVKVKNEEMGRPFPSLYVAKTHLYNVVAFCNDDQRLKMSFLENLFALDTGQDFEVIYQLFSIEHLHVVHVRSSIERYKPQIKSVTDVWPAAKFFEREIEEMYGIHVERSGERSKEEIGPFLLPANWSGYPMRKDYAYPHEFGGILHRRDPQRKDHLRP